MRSADAALAWGITTATGAPEANRWPPVQLYAAAMQGKAPARGGTDTQRALGPGTATLNPLSQPRTVVGGLSGDLRPKRRLIDVKKSHTSP
jgi:hypothetical protein